MYLLHCTHLCNDVFSWKEEKKDISKVSVKSAWVRTCLKGSDLNISIFSFVGYNFKSYLKGKKKSLKEG